MHQKRLESGVLLIKVEAQWNVNWDHSWGCGRCGRIKVEAQWNVNEVQAEVQAAAVAD